MNFTFTAKVASNNGKTFDVNVDDIASVRAAEGTKGGTVVYFKDGDKRIVTDDIADVVQDLRTIGINLRNGFVL